MTIQTRVISQQEFCFYCDEKSKGGDFCKKFLIENVSWPFALPEAKERASKAGWLLGKKDLCPACARKQQQP